MIQSLKGNLSHHKFLSALVNLDLVWNDIFLVRLMDLIKHSQVVHQLQYLGSIRFKSKWFSNAVS